MKKLLSIIGLSLIASTAMADNPTWTTKGQCPAVSEISIVKGTKTINGGQPQTVYMYDAFTNHNGLKMFTSMHSEPSKVAVTAFNAAIIDHFPFFKDPVPVACQYTLANGDKVLLLGLDPVGEFENIAPDNSGNWGGNTCVNSDPSACQWVNNVDPTHPHAQS